MEEQFGVRPSFLVVVWRLAVSVSACLCIALVLASSLTEPGRPAMTHKLTAPPCDEVYMVQEGETLQTIANRCNDPFIIERNPQLCDPDDVFPGLVLQIIPQKPR